MDAGSGHSTGGSDQDHPQEKEMQKGKIGDLGLIPGVGRSPGEGKGYPLQYSGWENSKDHIVHGVAKNRTRLSLPKSVPSSAFLLDFPLISVATLE